MANLVGDVHSLETIALERYPRGIEGTVPLEFASAPKELTRSFRSLPIVLVVATQSTSSHHDAFFDTVRLLRSSSMAFRIVLLTDRKDLSKLRELEWAIEHVVGENDYVRAGNGNWIEYVGRRLEWIVEYYGVSYVLPVPAHISVDRSLRNFGRFFGITPIVTHYALTRYKERVEQIDDSQHFGWRGWLLNLPPGKSAHRVLLPGGDEVLTRVHKRGGSSTLIYVDSKPDSQLVCEAAADELGWNMVHLNALGRGSRGHDAWLQQALRAFRYAFGESPVTVILGEAVSSASSEACAVFNIEGRIWRGRDGAWVLHTVAGSKVVGDRAVSSDTLSALERSVRTARHLGHAK